MMLLLILILVFCCDIDEETANELVGRPEVLLVKPDPNFDSVQKDHSSLNIGFRLQSTYFYGNTLLFPAGTTKHWLVRMGRPAVGAIRKAFVVDYFTQVIMGVLGNEKDAQMSTYHVSWQSNYGFCCELDNECAQELAGIPGVLSVQKILGRMIKITMVGHCYYIFWMDYVFQMVMNV